MFETTETEKQLLSDDEVRRFITDGYLKLAPDVPADVHQRIDERLLWVLRNEGNPGNNILPAVPEMQTVLDSPVVRGALESVLGPNYVLHPHRFAHTIEPAELTEDGLKVGKGSQSFVGWHQDSHSPLARPRHHCPRYAMILYYPQDTPKEMGPTQLIPGTHLQCRISDADRERGIQADGPAGACVLVHFDIVHGGSLNIADRTRSMVKFVFVRTEEPTAPSWNCQEAKWKTPKNHQAPFESLVVWTHLWNWMSGRTQEVTPFSQNGVFPPRSVQDLLPFLGEEYSLTERITTLQVLAEKGEAAAEATPHLMNLLEAEELLRLNSLYTLARIGESAVPALSADLRQRTQNRWNEGAVPMESSAYALAAIGKPAVPALLSLLEEESEWVQINAIFALGEIGSQAAEAVPALIEKLAHPSHPVVRTTLDALGQIRIGTRAALPAIEKLLLCSHPDWETPMLRQWSGQDQVRLNAVMALLRMGEEATEAETMVIRALNDVCGYVGGFGIEFLLRRQTPTALQAALHYLRAHRWDNTLKQGVRTY